MKSLSKCLSLLLLSLVLVVSSSVGGGEFVYASVNDNVGVAPLKAQIGEYTDNEDTETVFGFFWKIWNQIQDLKQQHIALDQKLDSVFQSASDGKMLLQSSLATIGSRVGVASSLGSEPASFAEINDSLNAIALQYDTKLGQLSEEAKRANALTTLVVSSKGWSGDYDGNNHGISVTVDTDLYDVKYGTTPDGCTLTSSPVYKAYGDYTIYYSIIGKENSKAMQGSETVKIKPLAGGLTLSSTSASIPKGSTTTVTATNKSGGDVTASSSNTSIATVSKSGNTFTVKGVSPGTCTINFVGERSDSRPGGTASMSVTVPSTVKLGWTVKEDCDDISYSVSGNDLRWDNGGCWWIVKSFYAVYYTDADGVRQQVRVHDGEALIRANSSVEVELSCRVQYNGHVDKNRRINFYYNNVALPCNPCTITKRYDAIADETTYKNSFVVTKASTLDIKHTIDHVEFSDNYCNVYLKGSCNLY